MMGAPGHCALWPYTSRQKHTVSQSAVPAKIPGVSPIGRSVLAAVVCVLAACGDDDSTNTAAAGLCPAEPDLRWSEETVPVDTQYLSVWGRSESDVWAVGWDQTIIHFDGQEWSEEVVERTLPQSSTVTPPLTSVYGTALPNNAPTDDPTFDPGPVFAVGWEGTILQRGADAVWRDAPRPANTATVTDDLFGVFVHDEENAMAVGDTGRMWLWDGVEWRKPRFRVPGEFSGEFIEPRGKLHAVWSRNGDTYFVVGSGGAAYRSNGSPTEFVSTDTRFAAPLRGVWGTGNENVYSVGLDSIILRFTNQWRRVQNQDADEVPTTFLFGIHGRRGRDFLVVGWQGIALHYDGRWRAEDTRVTTDLRGVWMAPLFPADPEDPESRLVDRSFAVGASGTVLRREVPPPIQIVTSDLPDAEVGVPYMLDLEFSGPEAVSWCATDLPPGLRLSADGRIRGTPTENSDLRPVFRASAAGWRQASRTLRLRVTGGEPAP